MRAIENARIDGTALALAILIARREREMYTFVQLNQT